MRVGVRGRGRNGVEVLSDARSTYEEGTCSMEEGLPGPSVSKRRDPEQSGSFATLAAIRHTSVWVSGLARLLGQ